MSPTRTFALFVASAAALLAGPSFTIDATRSTGSVSPRLYGLMTEEINHSYDGGLYAELIRNHAFLDDNNSPANWLAVKDDASAASITLDPANPLNENIPTSLRLTVTQATQAHPAGVANSGYWGIPVHPQTQYRASLWAKAESGFTGPLSVSIVSEDGRTVYSSGKISGLTTKWKKFEVKLTTGNVAPTAQARFAVTVDQPGTVWLGLVSLFPPTWNDRPNGLRKDLMQMLVDLHPKFLRFPGGNFVEGVNVEDRFPWKKTLGPIEDRPGHNGSWGYRPSDGMGLLEFLEWCEDMRAEPVLAVYAGYSLAGGYIKAGPDLKLIVQEALDEIEYVIGGTNTPWGARRAKDGHPAPFKLNYVEIGNEDAFDKAKTYDGRYAQLHDAIKAKYPQLNLISTIPGAKLEGRKPDMEDYHDYSSTENFLKKSVDYGKDLNRKGPEVFVGEWAAHEDTAVPPWNEASKKMAPTPSMKAAIGDAVFMAAMERNADIIKMHCYAPLLVNVNPGAWQWRPDMIGYDALTSFGSPSYYAFGMFSRNVGDEILSVNFADTSVQGCAARDSQTGEIIIKLVNPESSPQTLPIAIKGVTSLKPEATVITLSAKPEDTNSISEPKNVVPVTTTLRGIKPGITYTLPPTSIVVIKLKSL
ncbi:MAG: carbohydrate binding domain-containing protein [Verrucomicrobia bacterium]|nr:carbohydrate binding domain-containing protein [Verrucomicrobiota bacterium]